MIQLSDIVRSVMGALRLARLDPAGMHFFDTSIEGFWRSFWAAALLAPPYFYLASFRVEHAAGDGVHAWLVEIIAYAINWTAFQVAALYLTEAFERAGRYVTYIVAYNWAAVVQFGIDFPAALIFLHTDGVVPDEIRVLFVLAVTAVLWFYQFFVARTALDVPGPIAMAIVACDILIGYVLRQAINYLHGPAT
jgi:hypothetical protein